MSTFLMICPNCGATDSYKLNIHSQVKCMCGTEWIKTEFKYSKYEKQLKDVTTPLDYWSNLCDILNIIGTQRDITISRWQTIADSKLAAKRKDNIKRLDALNLQRQNQLQDTIKCPYCNSADVVKISTLNRAVSVGLVGLASSKIGKQFHCNNCKSDF